MRRVRWLPLMLVVVLAVVTVAGYEVRRIPSEQQVALRLLSVPSPEPGGLDAAPLFWSMDHAVPPGAEDAVLQAVRTQVERRQQQRRLPVGQKSVARWQLPFPRIPLPPQRHPVLCAAQGHDCLATVRSRAGETLKLLQDHPQALARAKAVSGLGSFRYPAVPDIAMALPPFLAHRPLLLSHHAYEFVSGRRAEALSGLCSDLHAWRKIMVDADLQAASIAADEAVDQDLRLLAEMLAESPNGQALPEACAAALAEPVRDEYSVCMGLRTDFRMMANSMGDDLLASPAAWRGRPLARWSFDADRLLARMAPHYAAHCDAGALARVAKGERWNDITREPALCTPLESAFDPGVCRMFGRVKPDKSRHQDGRADTLAKIHLMRTLLWLRGQEDFPAGSRQLLAQDPGLARGARQAFLSTDGRHLEIPLHEHTAASPWVLRLEPAAGLDDDPVLPAL